ncbi:MAG: ATP-binding cassette domain-containing protein [bacterium]
MKEPAIEVEGLVRRFGEKTAVDGIDFQVGAGEVFGFLGPNGAGKSTTQRILSTLLFPSGGKARIFGRDVVREAGAVRRRIGRVPEESSVYPELTGLQNLTFTARLYRVPGGERERRTRDLFDQALMGTSFLPPLLDLAALPLLFVLFLVPAGMLHRRGRRIGV